MANNWRKASLGVAIGQLLCLQLFRIPYQDFHHLNDGENWPCTKMESSQSSTDILFPLIATVAAASVASLAIFQTDRVSQWTLTPTRLLAKRRQEYDYRWKTAVEKAHLQLDYYLAGGSDKFNTDPEINLKKCTYLDNPEEEDSLVKRIVDETSQTRFTILKIDRDPSDPHGEFYVFLMGEEEGYETAFFQAQLISFCSKLRLAFEKQSTSTVFCFVADASSGKASHLLETLMKEAKMGVTVISEPLWMTTVARLGGAKIYSTKELETILFSLCRLEAWKIREQVEVSHTVVMTLPGQSTVAALLPLVQSVFPKDRHVFAYDSCMTSVARGMEASSSLHRGTLQTELKTICSRLSQNPIRYTVPLPTTLPLTKSIGGLTEALAHVPIAQAGVLESWMSSVDAYLRLKDEEELNGYAPYVLKLSHLTNPVDSADSLSILSSLLRFITGKFLQCIQSM